MEEPKLQNKKKTRKFAVDEQTGKSFELLPEQRWDIAAATISILYLIAMLLFFSWLLIDIVIGQNVLLRSVSPRHTAYLKSPIFKLIVYTVIGGGLGGVVNGIRSFIIWHAERMAFGWRFIWKYITLPLVGTILAAVVYAIVRGGLAVFGGTFESSQDIPTQALAAFAIGALTGYGSHKVFIWLDKQVNKLFKTPPVAEIKVPDLKGKTQKEAEDILKESHLKLGKVDRKVADDPAKVNKIIDQNPPADSVIASGGSVDIVIATKA